jgi:TnpA family transposase
VIRTGFLLRYISNSQLRSTIQGATNKSEALNRFLKWAFFGGEGIIAENSRDEQRKAIKYNHLVANCLIFHNQEGVPSKAPLGRNQTSLSESGRTRRNSATRSRLFHLRRVGFACE